MRAAAAAEFGYFLFLQSGLIHLFPSFLCSYLLPSSSVNLISLSPFLMTLVSIPCLSWKSAVYSLCFGHILHSYSIYHLYGAFVILFFSIVIVTMTEELSLRYGLIFGRYAFTLTFGERLTEHFPLLALACWICLIYPNILLTNLIMNGFSYQLPSVSRILPSTLLGATLLTYFDIVSEPIHAHYGHKLWHHAAFIDPFTPLTSYIPQPDWIFEPNQPYQEFYFNIPFQV